LATSDESAAATADELARIAEDEAKAAESRAETARARAEELRRRIAEARETDHNDAQGGSGQPAETDAEPLSTAARSAMAARARSIPILPAVAVGLAALLTAGLLAASGFMVWQHRKNSQQLHSAAEFSAAARQDVVNLMSIDFNTAQDSVQRVLDSSTGRFRDNFQDAADDFVKALKDEKIVTRATVNDTAVESMTADSAVVLVSATSHREDPKAPKDQQQPRLWRVSVTLERADGQIKMSGVDFI
jgi:Mce-associated membrane protein